MYQLSNSVSLANYTGMVIYPCLIKESGPHVHITQNFNSKWIVSLHVSNFILPFFKENIEVICILELDMTIKKKGLVGIHKII